MSEKARQAGTSKAVSPKDGDDALDEIDELLERWDNRLSFNNLSLVERYIKGEVRIIVEARVSSWAVDAVDYRAIFQGASAPLVDDERGRWKPSPREIVRRAYVHGANRYNGLVSVEPGELVENPEGFGPSMVWLQSPDEPGGPCADALYFSRGVGFKFFDRPTYRKSGAVRRLMPVRAYEFAYHLVEGGAEIKDHVADDAAEVSRNRLVDLDSTDWVSALRIYLADDFVGVACVEREDLRVQLVDVAFGPFNLYPNAN